jgi:phage/plasmid-like protein (TIGR03299 family)
MTAANTIRADGFAELATTHEAAKHVWQGKDFGQRLTRGADVETWARESGMDMHIQRAKVRYATGHGQDADSWATLDDMHVLMRADTKAPLGVVSAAFKIVQPIELLRTLAHEARRAGFELETAGTLFGGRKFWAMASDGQQAEIGKGDVVLNRTLLATATDGTMSTVGKKTSVCVVCANTLGMALSDSNKATRQSHRSVYNAESMARALGLVHDEAGFQSFTDTARRLADRAVSKDRAERILFDLLKPAALEITATTDVALIEKVTDSAAFRKVLALFNGEGMGATLDGRAGTAWGLLNAVTQYADHEVRATSADNRTQAAWFGAGDKLKTRALEMLTA